MIHGTTDKITCWCGTWVNEAGGWTGDYDEVECLGCLRIKIHEQQAVVDAARAECQNIIRGANIALSSPQAELSTSLVWVTEMETANKILRALLKAAMDAAVDEVKP
jgi:hypothetical protein